MICGTESRSLPESCSTFPSAVSARSSQSRRTSTSSPRHKFDRHHQTPLKTSQAMASGLLFICAFAAIVCPSLVLGQESTTGPSFSTGSPVDAGNVTLPSTACEKLDGHEHMRRCYFVDPSANRSTFDEAQAFCESELKGDLASVETKEAQDFVRTILDKLKIEEDIWIGARFRVHEGHADHHGGGFHWILSDKAVSDNYSNFANGTSQNLTADSCVYMSKSGQWQVGPCSKSLMSICEWDLEKDTKDKAVVWAIAYALLGIVLVALLIGCCVFCLINRSREGQRRGSGGGGGGKFRGIYYKKSSTRKGTNGSEY